MTDRIRVRKVPNHPELICVHLYDKLENGDLVPTSEIAIIGYDHTADLGDNRTLMCEMCGHDYSEGVALEVVQ